MGRSVGAMPPIGTGSSPRPITRGMRAFIYLVTVLTFTSGAQLTVLAEHTETFFAWPLGPPMSAVFMGASFAAASAILLWAARQRDWTRAAVIIPAVLLVAILILQASLDHLDEFGGPLGAIWIEAYAIVPPLTILMLVIQLARPGVATPRQARLPREHRLALTVQAPVMLAIGGLLYLAPGDTASLWPWPLTELGAQAIGAWIVGIGLIAGHVAVRDDRADLPVPSLSYLVLGGLLLLGVVRFPGDLDFADPSAWAFIAYLLGALAVGIHGTRLARREGRFASARPQGGIAVELSPRAARARGENGEPQNDLAAVVAGDGLARARTKEEG